MYLISVFLDVYRGSQSPNILGAEHLYTVNEVVFIQPEDESIDSIMADHIFHVMQKIHTPYSSGPDQILPAIMLRVQCTWIRCFSMLMTRRLVHCMPVEGWMTPANFYAIMLVCSALCKTNTLSPTNRLWWCLLGWQKLWLRKNGFKLQPSIELDEWHKHAVVSGRLCLSQMGILQTSCLSCFELVVCCRTSLRWSCLVPLKQVAVLIGWIVFLALLGNHRCISPLLVFLLAVVL